MRVLIAPDKFKGSLTAVQVAQHLARGVRSAGGVAYELPLADGGDGSVDAAVAGGARRCRVDVPDALGSQHEASYAFDDGTAVIEVANTCGLQLLGTRRAALDASSVGVGVAMRAALVQSLQRLVLAVGGSASTDGGAGLLAALGARFYDHRGAQLTPTGRSLEAIGRVDASALVDLRGLDLVLASDVTNPLLGPAGAAATYGPQKGAGPADIARLERGLAHYVDVLRATWPDSPAIAADPGAGSAGGVGFAALLLGARIMSGAEYFMQTLGFAAAVGQADLVVTGEGRLDHQTGQGKLVGVVARAASPVPVDAVVGHCDLRSSEWADLGLRRVYALADRSVTPTSDDPDLTAELLIRIGAELAARP